jgi:molybdopterin synthase catalytic subunit
MKYDGWIDINNNIDIIKLQNSMEILNKVGSVLTFTGLVRETSIKSDKKVIGIEIETWEDKADEIMRKIANKIGNNNNLHGIRIVHLKGKMVVGDPIVFIIIYSEHRKEGFKNNSPVWKKEIYEDLTSQWITTKEELKKAFE